MKRETKLGLLAIVTLVVIFLGYRFLKGAGVFSSQNSFSIVYEEVDGLGTGDLVAINGFRVGLVTDVQLNPENVRSLIVTIGVDDELPIPKNATALIESDGILGGKFISLVFDKACSGGDCAVSGDYLTAAEQTVLAGLIGDPAELTPYFDLLRSNAGPVIDSITSRTDTNGIGRTLRNFETTSRNLAALTEKIDRLLARSSNDLTKTLNSVAGITANLESNNAKIGSILSNVDSTTRNLATVDLGKTLQDVELALTDLRKTLNSSSGAIENLDRVTQKIDSGEGSLGKLINDPGIYDRLDRVMANTDLLLQDFRLNPKRYVGVSVFGKKQKEYDLPENDPAKDNSPSRETPALSGRHSTGPLVDYIEGLPSDHDLAGARYSHT